MVKKEDEKIYEIIPRTGIPCLNTIMDITERQKGLADNADHLISQVTDNPTTRQRIRETLEGLNGILELEKRGICDLPDPLSSCPLRFGRDGICAYLKGELQKEDI